MIDIACTAHLARAVEATHALVIAQDVGEAIEPAAVSRNAP
jgi:hypothetical protein